MEASRSAGGGRRDVSQPARAHPERLELVGRDEELRHLDELIRRVEAGSPQFVAIEGAPGIGKTELVNALLERVSGWRHLVIELDPADAAQPGATVGRLIEHLGGDAANAPGTLAGLVQVVLDATEAVDGQTCVVIEETQWADELSAEVLWRCARELRQGRSLVVITQRPNDSAFTERMNRFLASGRSGMHIVLDPLDVRQVQEALSLRLRMPVSYEVARTVHEATGGVPLLVNTIANRLAAAPAGQRRLSDALDALSREHGGRQRLFENTLLSALEALPEAERMAVALLAVAGRPMYPGRLNALLASVDGAPVTASTLMQTELVAARGAAGELAISHAYLASLIAAQLPPEVSARLHHALTDQTDQTEALRHRVYAHRHGWDDDTAQLVTELIGLATASLRAGDARAAFTLCRWALWFTDDIGVLALALRAAVVAGDPGLVAQIRAEIERAAPGRVRSAGLAQLLLGEGALSAAAVELNRGLAAPETSPDGAGTLLIGHTLATGGRAAYASGSFGALAATIDRGKSEVLALRTALERGLAADPALAARVMPLIVEARSLEAILTMWSGLRHGDPARLGEFAPSMSALLEELGDVVGTETVRDHIACVMAGTLRQLGDPVAAYPHLSGVLDRHLVPREAEVHAGTHLGLIAFQAGHWDDAQTLLTRALESCLLLPDDSGTLLTFLAASLVPLARGEREEGESLLERAAALDGQGGEVVSAALAHARAVRALFAGEHDEAAAQFSLVDETGLGWAYVGPPWLVPFARELVLAGEGARVQDVLERAEEAVMRNERAQHALIDAVRGHLAVSRGDVTGASEWFRAALSIWDEEPSVRAGAALRKGGGFALQRALTALDLATVVNGHPAELWESKDDAIAAARDAGEFFLRCGAVGLREEAARLERALLGGRPAESRTEAAEGAPHGAGGERGAELDEARERAYRRMSVLTSRERQVSLEVVAGKSNREIATDLYLSVRTVEYHLGNCLSKLGISSRGELRRALRPAADHLSMRSPTP